MTLPAVFSRFFFPEKYDFWKNKTPEKGQFQVTFDNFCPSAPMSFFFGGVGGDDDDTTLRRRRRRDKSEITWPLPHRTQGPNTS